MEADSGGMLQRVPSRIAASLVLGLRRNLGLFLLISTKKTGLHLPTLRIPLVAFEGELTQNYSETALLNLGKRGLVPYRVVDGKSGTKLSHAVCELGSH